MSNVNERISIPEDEHYVCDDLGSIIRIVTQVPESYEETVHMYGGDGIYLAHDDLYETLEDGTWTECGVIWWSADSDHEIEFSALTYPQVVLGMTHPAEVTPDFDEIRIEGTLVYRRVTREEMGQWAR